MLISWTQEFDEDELEAELDALGEELELEEQEKLDDQLLNIGPAVGLPEVPSSEPTRAPVAAVAAKKKTADEEDPDMAELAAWASWSWLKKTGWLWWSMEEFLHVSLIGLSSVQWLDSTTDIGHYII